MKKLIKPGSEPQRDMVSGSIENTPRICPEVLSLLNKQITNELFSSQIYAAMASWLDDKGWPGGSKLFLKYSKEEQDHMYKIYDYIFLKNCKAMPAECPKPPCDYSDIRDLLNKSLEHEIKVTQNWVDISECAKNNSCPDVVLFAEWFLNEQRTEEDKFRKLLFYVNLDMPKWYLDTNIELLAGE